MDIIPMKECQTWRSDTNLEIHPNNITTWMVSSSKLISSAFPTTEQLLQWFSSSDSQCSWQRYHFIPPVTSMGYPYLEELFTKWTFLHGRFYSARKQKNIFGFKNGFCLWQMWAFVVCHRNRPTVDKHITPVDIYGSQLGVVQKSGKRLVTLAANLFSVESNVWSYATDVYHNLEATLNNYHD